MREIELRLSGHAGPPGELRADHAARIGETLQSLVLRLTREAAGVAGLGRPVRVLEQIGEVRLAGVAEGSTRLIYRVGDSTSLDVDPLSDAVDAMFVEIVDGMARNRLPSFATDTIAQAVDDFAGALQKSARRVSASLSGDSASELSSDRSAGAGATVCGLRCGAGSLATFGSWACSPAMAGLTSRSGDEDAVAADARLPPVACWSRCFLARSRASFMRSTAGVLLFGFGLLLFWPGWWACFGATPCGCCTLRWA